MPECLSACRLCVCAVRVCVLTGREKSVDDLIDDLRTALVRAGAVTVTVDGMTAGVPTELADHLPPFE